MILYEVLVLKILKATWFRCCCWDQRFGCHFYDKESSLYIWYETLSYITNINLYSIAMSWVEVVGGVGDRMLCRELTYGYGIAFLYLERGFSSDLLICTQQNSGSLGKKLPALHKLEFPDQHKLTMIEREKIIMTRYRLIFMCKFQKKIIIIY